MVNPGTAAARWVRAQRGASLAIAVAVGSRLAVFAAGFTDFSGLPAVRFNDALRYPDRVEVPTGREP